MRSKLGAVVAGILAALVGGLALVGCGGGGGHGGGGGGTTTAPGTFDTSTFDNATFQ